MGSAVRNIRSFIIIDLETTGLPICDRKVKITELVMVGALREHMLELCREVDGPYLPRVLPKLSLYAYPKKAISPFSSDITGLSNELLENVNPFDEDLVNIINGFIQRLPPPVCLIAHNGNKFDFPVLQAELHNVGKTLPGHLLCADSLPALREIMHSKTTEYSSRDKETCGATEGIYPFKTCDLFKHKENRKLEYFGDELDNDDYDESLYKIAESVELEHLRLSVSALTNCNTSTTTNGEQNLSANQMVYAYNEQKSDTESSDQQSMHLLQKHLETTPKQRIKAQKNMPLHNRANLSPQVTPTSISNRNGQQLAKSSRARKKLFSSEKKADGSIPKSFKLCDVYQFLLKKEALNAHHAESDCLNLLECIVVLAPEFLEWVDKNAVEFKELKKLW